MTKTIDISFPTLHTGKLETGHITIPSVIFGKEEPKKKPTTASAESEYTDEIPYHHLDVLSVECSTDPLELLRHKTLETDDSFHIVDLGEVYRQVKAWRQYLPHIKPFYAIKSCPDPLVLQVMVDLGMSFDCASKGEIKKMLGYGVHPDRIIYANPCKQPSHVKFAKAHNVLKTSFDSISELHKMKKYHPNAELFIRIYPDDSGSKVPFSAKFGARAGPVTLELLREALKLGLNVTGISFHVGSDDLNPDSYVETIRRARIVYDQAMCLGHPITVMDVGGGFPGARNSDEFHNIAKAVNLAIERYFPEGIELIAEPGRFFSASSFTLATNIIAKRSKLEADTIHKNFEYFINDGAFKSFTEGVLVPETVYTPCPLYPTDAERFPVTIWGPALGAMDKVHVPDNYTLPELEIGDWIYFKNMGAYSVCFNMEFNGFEQSPRFYTNTEKQAYIQEFNKHDIVAQ